MSWRKKTLVVTGASRGIGRALAEALAMLGANVVLNARSKPPLKEAAAALHASFGVEAAAVAGDASQEKVARACVEKAQALGEFMGVIHCAGVLHPGPYVWELDEAAYDEVVDASCKAAWQLARAAYPALGKAGRGLFVLVGSGAASIAQPGIGVYCAAKAFEEHLMRQLAAETSVITCFAYQPGKVETRMQEQARAAQGGAGNRLRELFGGWKERGELLTPEAAAAWLCRELQADWRRHHGKVVRIGE